MRAALLMTLLGGCTFAPIDHDGQREPCLPGFVADAGRCWRAGDAGPERDAGATRDASISPDGSTDAGLDAPDDAGCVLACEGDEIIACGGGRSPSACDDEAAVICRDGALVRAPCPTGCEAPGVARCALTISFGAGATGLDDLPGLGDLVVPAGETYELDTDTGRIVSGATEIRSNEAGVRSGIGFQTVAGAPGAPTLAVLAVRSLAVFGTLRARGAAALALVAQIELAIGTDGIIDVSADARAPGPGGGAGGATTGYVGGSMCTDNPNDGAGPGGGAGGVSSGFYAGGGGGGGFGTAGAEGGDAGGCAEGGAGGSAAFTRSSLRGGGGGGGGGDRLATGSMGPNAGGGGGGGAVLLVAGVRLSLLGAVDASGGGGDGGGEFGGGGGGGAGGLVWLEAPIVERAAGSVIGANGGGGGAGGMRECLPYMAPDSRACTVADPPGGGAGADGRARSPRAGGGASAGPLLGGLGGHGSDASGVPRAGEYANFNGGAGGGGAGRIVIRTTDGTPAGGATYPSAPALVTIEPL